ncbi:hypothetical protein CWI38_0292p0050 [Hamiltosporidium tvaerminnensis]|uniref:Uncharacterized protein n=1 Tax=Hamiltosporidium tvaerminnensis TaxID=1176355 RepID=A0A4Q9LYM6_9MICR|nr:hypothetical protein LUQ84_000428 [Hamiltosporidium tvaerminnensis]TBU17005.1 hypothetical protein CWI38_0292p0050 [Hamiltosporidium tvaerminnensis]
MSKNVAIKLLIIIVISIGLTLFVESHYRAELLCEKMEGIISESKISLEDIISMVDCLKNKVGIVVKKKDNKYYGVVCRMKEESYDKTETYMENSFSYFQKQEKKLDEELDKIKARKDEIQRDPNEATVYFKEENTLKYIWNFDKMKDFYEVIQFDFLTQVGLKTTLKKSNGNVFLQLLNFLYKYINSSKDKYIIIFLEANENTLSVSIGIKTNKTDEIKEIKNFIVQFEGTVEGHNHFSEKALHKLVELPLLVI